MRFDRLTFAHLTIELASQNTYLSSILSYVRLFNCSHSYTVRSFVNEHENSSLIKRCLNFEMKMSCCVYQKQCRQQFFRVIIICFCLIIFSIISRARLIFCYHHIDEVQYQTQKMFFCGRNIPITMHIILFSNDFTPKKKKKISDACFWLRHQKIFDIHLHFVD